MGKRLLTTPRGKVRSALRLLWMRSRERQAALRRTGYCCTACGVKQSKAKGREVAIEVHHRKGIGNWEAVIDLIFAEILCRPELLEPLCKECHKQAEVEP